MLNALRLSDYMNYSDANISSIDCLNIYGNYKIMIDLLGNSNVSSSNYLLFDFAYVALVLRIDS
jgi:hypothetical protein